MDVAGKILADFKRLGLALIDRMVDEGYREDLHLDFKRKSRPEFSRLDEDDRRNYARALAGFANSDSGVIVWGIGAPGSGSNERTKHPISGVVGFAEHLDSMISRLVSPIVDGVENFVIFEDEAEGTGYVVSYVPKSRAAPHRSEQESHKHYYKRYGDSFKVAEHYELEYMFGRRLTPELKIFWASGVKRIEPANSDDPLVTAAIRIGLTNLGREIAKYSCLRLRFDETSFYRYDDKQRSDLIHYSPPIRASRTNFVAVTARALPGLVVYPSDYMDFFTFSFTASASAILSGSLPKFPLTYDIFAENFINVTGVPFVIAGKKIRDSLKKSLAERGV